MNEFNTDSKALQNALKAMKPFVDPKPYIPILGYVKLESQDGVLRIMAVTGERCGTEPSYTMFTVETAFCPRYSIAVRFDDLNKIAAKLRGEVMINAVDEKLSLKTERLSFSINGKDAIDFPTWTSDRGEMLASSAVQFDDIASELEFVSRATEKNAQCHFTNGVLFDYATPDRLRLVGTDGRRLHSTFTRSRTISATPSRNSGFCQFDGSMRLYVST